MEAAREHIEEIRKTKFSIGGEQNPLTEDLHQAVKNLSAELYAKDIHFLMELIQVFHSFSLTITYIYVCFIVCYRFFLMMYGYMLVNHP